MSLIDSIAHASTALATAKVQNQVAVKVLKIAQGQGQVAADLISAAVENLEQVIADFAADLGSQFDAYA